MLFLKKKGLVLEHQTLQSKHKDGSPVVSPILAPTGSHSKPDTKILPDNKVVSSGIDTLVVTAGGKVAPSNWLINKQFIWSEYQKQYDYSVDDFLQDEINGSWWSIRPYGMKQYKFVIDNPQIGHIRIWNVDKWSSGVMSSQHIYCDFRSSWIHQHTREELYEAVVSILGVFFNFTSPDELNIQISRIDEYADVTNGNTFLTEDQIQNSISRSRDNQYFLSDDALTLSPSELDLIEGAPLYNKGTHKLIPVALVDKMLTINNNQISIGYDSINFKKDIETAYFGKKSSNVWGKCYNKTKCCRDKNDLDTPLLWSSNGWNGSDTVVRTEFSMRRAFIKELDGGIYVKLDKFLSNADKVWEWMTTKWLRLVTEVKKNNIQTSPISKFWSVVQSAYKSCKDVVIRKRNYSGKVSQLITQGLGCFKQATSLAMKDNDDFSFCNALGQAVSKSLLNAYSSGEYLQRRIKLGIA